MILGAGAAGDRHRAAAARGARRATGVAAGDLLGAVALVDSKGLVVDAQDELADDSDLRLAGRAGGGARAARGLVPAPASCARSRPTVLVGVTGVRGPLHRGARARDGAARGAARDLLPLSNPTSGRGAAGRPPAWTDGRALVATGSPFDPVDIGRPAGTHRPGNNVFIFPGVGLGAVVAEAREVTDDMFLVAARDLSGLVTDERLAAGAIFPPVGDLRRVARGSRSPWCDTCATRATGASTATRISNQPWTGRCGGRSTCPSS